MLKKMKLTCTLITALIFVFIFTGTSLSASAKSKSSTAESGFDSHITNNSLAVSPNEDIAVVSDSRESSLLIYDLAKGKVSKKISGFVTPRDIEFVDSGSQFVVSDSTHGTLRFYDSKNLKLKDEVVVGPGAFGLAVSPDEKTLYVNNEAHSTVTVVNLETRKPVEVITGFAQPRQGITVSPDGKHVFVTNFEGDKVSVVESATNTIVNEITGFSSIRGISATIDGTALYAANSSRDAISVVDLSQNKIVSEITVGDEPYGATLSPDNKLLFASNKADNTIDVIDTSNHQIIKTINGFNEPRQAIVFNQAGEQAYVLNRDLSISVVDVKELVVIDTIHNDKTSKYNLQVKKSEQVGKYLADAEGMTLYYFTKDEPGVSNCKGACLEIWPPFHAENIKAPGSFDKKDFGTIVREDGQKQTTYKGYPLYYFVNDKQPGDINGQGVKDVWYVINKKTFKN
ncbi:cytochrome D1 domain-containing protein [Sporosarcina globispora]|uniref:cytochrome D1 domain-containing protein n=1 Tax=Sporosarcina globispora TaxID=1459 RepID=UPI0009EBFB37|nr:cytochrome D1 domain-containing protein [Sporosarcina globispora]